MKRDDISKIHKLCIQKNLPFATFRLPHKSVVTTYIQKTPKAAEWESISDLSVKEGFIMAPFDTRNGKKYIMLRPDIVVDNTNDIKPVLAELHQLSANNLPSWELPCPVLTERDEYLDQVKSIRRNINTGFFQKTVLSRIGLVEGDYISLISDIFFDACEKHPNAFVYVFKSDNHFWLGASPEPLLRLSEGTISTVSLAGTRPFAEENMELNKWTMKEVLEQEYVTRYIHDVLREFKVQDYRVTSPYVKRAGDLVHLRTDFSFDFDQVSVRLWEFLQVLHPTPAVAGHPKEKAITFIKQLEPHDREYYAGFLGPVSPNGNIDLFVNLRCMKITPDYLALFVGGGITLESDPADEWEETRLKALSLLNIIQPYI